MYEIVDQNIDWNRVRSEGGLVNKTLDFTLMPDVSGCTIVGTENAEINVTHLDKYASCIRFPEKEVRDLTINWFGEWRPNWHAIEPGHDSWNFNRGRLIVNNFGKCFGGIQAIHQNSTGTGKNYWELIHIANAEITETLGEAFYLRGFEAGYICIKNVEAYNCGLSELEDFDEGAYAGDVVDVMVKPSCNVQIDEINSQNNYGGGVYTHGGQGVISNIYSKSNHTWKHHPYGLIINGGGDYLLKDSYFNNINGIRNFKGSLDVINTTIKVSGYGHSNVIGSYRDLGNNNIGSI